MHINKVKEWISRNEISKECPKFIVNEISVPGKNTTLYKTPELNNPVCLLTGECNTAIACALLTNNFEVRTRNTSYLLDIIDGLNSETIPNNTILVSFDIQNMYLSIDSDRGIAPGRNALETRANRAPSTDRRTERLKIF